MQYGANDDAEIEQQAPVLQIIEVVFYALLNRSVAAPAVDLRPAGYADLEIMPSTISGNFYGELFNEVRTLWARPNYAHIAFKHIEELWEFVEAGSAQKCADAGATGIVR
jgi:hypothetical protein